MKKVLEVLNAKNIACGYLYAYVHLITEIACFYMLYKITNGSVLTWMVPFVYDGMAFVPQSIIGYINDKYPKIRMGLIWQLHMKRCIRSLMVLV